MNATNELDHLTDEQLLFVQCVQDILAVTPGARWHLETDLEKLRRCRSAAFALFTIHTNPALEMNASLELGERSLVIVINSTEFRQRRLKNMAFDVWIDRCCRLLTRLTEADLQLTIKRVAGSPYRSELSVRHGKNWHKLCQSESQKLAIARYLLPFGIGLFLAGEKTTEFPEWANAVDLIDPDTPQHNDAAHDQPVE